MGQSPPEATTSLQVILQGFRRGQQELTSLLHNAMAATSLGQNQMALLVRLARKQVLLQDRDLLLPVTLP